jgi:hypothetical protein
MASAGAAEKVGLVQGSQSFAIDLVLKVSGEIIRQVTGHIVALGLRLWL